MVLMLIVDSRRSQSRASNRVSKSKSPEKTPKKVNTVSQSDHSGNESGGHNRSVSSQFNHTKRRVRRFSRSFSESGDEHEKSSDLKSVSSHKTGEILNFSFVSLNFIIFIVVLTIFSESPRRSTSITRNRSASKSREKSPHKIKDVPLSEVQAIAKEFSDSDSELQNARDNSGSPEPVPRSKSRVGKILSDSRSEGLKKSDSVASSRSQSRAGIYNFKQFKIKLNVNLFSWIIFSHYCNHLHFCTYEKFLTVHFYFQPDII